jgi:predicted PurR-regulated permease PerM
MARTGAGGRLLVRGRQRRGRAAGRRARRLNRALENAPLALGRLRDLPNPSAMDPQDEKALITRIVKISAAVLLIVGAVVVLRPFIVAGLFAAVYVLATWPLHVVVRSRVRGSNTWAATIMTLLAVVVVIVPFVWLVENAIERVPGWFALAQAWLADGLPLPPAWLLRVPLVGEILDQYWRDLSGDPGGLRGLGQRLFEFGREPLIRVGGVIGEGVLQLVLATFVAFFFYRDGDLLVRSLRAGMTRIAGTLAGELLAIVRDTVRGVVIGIVGTALAQGSIAMVGFLIAGVPAAVLLGGLTALVSIVPGGPVLVWVGATIWLLAHEEFGWAIFMAIWGTVLISSIDNVLRPLLISRGASLSFAMVFIGVVGGLVAFGFVGIFIGPTLLALTWRLWNTWVERRDAGTAAIAPESAAPELAAAEPAEPEVEAGERADQEPEDWEAERQEAQTWDAEPLEPEPQEPEPQEPQAPPPPRPRDTPR